MRFLLVMLSGCGPTVLSPGFESEVVQGWVCTGWGMLGPPEDATVVPVFYTALDAGETFRIQASLPAREATFPAEETEPVSTYLRVYTGASLIVDQGPDKCDDVISGSWQRLDYVYAAVEGTARVVEQGGGLALELDGVVLRADNSLLGSLGGADGWEELPDVPLDGVLPGFPPSP